MKTAGFLQSGLLLLVFGLFSELCGTEYKIGSGYETADGPSQLQEAGIHWTRVPIDFKNSDISGGVPSLTLMQQYDIRIQEAQSRGIYVLGILNPQPENSVWPSSDTMAATFKYFVERYDKDGKDDFPNLVYPIVYWEICNEYESNPVNPNDPSWRWKGLSESEYLQYCVKSKAAMREVYASGQFSAGSIVGAPNDGFKYLINNGFTPDFISFHGYSPTDFCVINGRKQLTALSASLDSIPLIITECAFYDNTNTTNATQVQNAKWLAMAMSQAFNLNTTRIIYTEFAANPVWTDNRLYWMTFIDVNGVKRPNYYTFKKLNETIGDFTAISKETTSSGANLYKYTTGSGGTVYIGWTDSESGGTIQVTGLTGCDYVTVTKTVPNTTADVVDSPVTFAETTATVSSGTANVTVTSDIPVYIVSHSKTCTVTFTAGTGGSISGTASQSVAYEGSCSAVTAVPDSGYQFVNWTKDSTEYSTSSSLTVTNVTADMTLKANFELIITYSVAVEASPTTGGTVSVSASTVNPGETVTLTATPGSGYTFAGWTASASGNAVIADSNSASTTAVINGNVTITGYFSSGTVKTANLTLAVSPSEGGTTEPTVGSTTSINQSIPYTIVATAASGYYFSTWSASVSTAKFGSNASSTTTVTISEDTQVTALFTTTPPETYTLTMAVSPDAAGTTVPEAGTETTVNYGGTMNITAVPGDGYVFAGWKADPAENAAFGSLAETETTVTLTGSVTVTALFSDGSSVDAGTISLNSGYKESLKKIDGESALVYKNQAGLSVKLKVNLVDDITEDTQVSISVGLYSFSGRIGDAGVKKLTTKGGSVKFMDSILGETVTIRWNASSAQISVSLKPPEDDDTNFLNLYSEVYGEPKVLLGDDIQVWISIEDRIFSNSVTYSGTGTSKYNKTYEDDLVKWSVKGKGSIEELSIDTGSGTDSPDLKRAED